MRNAAIVNIGDELLIGQVVNSNASFIAKQLSYSGIHVNTIICIADSATEIINSLKELSGKYDLLIFTGGLGPTPDDITKEAICEFFNDTLIENAIIGNRIRDYFRSRKMQLTENNRLQAMVPSKAAILYNSIGSAPGIVYERDGSHFCFLPGVPFEMEKLITDSLIPYLQSKFVLKPELHRTLLATGIGEGTLSELLKTFEDNLPGYMNLAYLPSPGIVQLRLSVHGDISEGAERVIIDKIMQLKELLGDYCFGEENEKIEEVLGKILLGKKYKLAIAESCTGGSVSSMITSVPGSSSWYTGGIVAYDNSVKVNELSVPPKLIEEIGVVSEEVVKSMAEGVADLLNTECSIAVSGIAGPEGGTPEKPVGTVYIAVKTPERTIAKRFFFGSDRMRNIQITSLTALNMLRKELLGILEKQS